MHGTSSSATGTGGGGTSGIRTGSAGSGPASGNGSGAGEMGMGFKLQFVLTQTGEHFLGGQIVQLHAHVGQPGLKAPSTVTGLGD